MSDFSSLQSAAVSGFFGGGGVAALSVEAAELVLSEGAAPSAGEADVSEDVVASDV